LNTTDLQSGELIGDRFRLEEKIGEGGMASVWRATDQTLNRPVAVKFLYIRDIRQHDNMIRAFLREARIAAAIRHRSVIDILDFGTHKNGLPFMVMELLEGESMEERLFRDNAFTLEEILTITARVLQGLIAVHDAGIVHRDIKPANIFLVKERTGFFPKLLDFGISRSTEPDSGRESALTTQDGRIVGTLEYMSSEQARGQMDIDKRTDIYSMGVILYELLTGRLPFESEHQGDLIVQIMTATPPSVVEIKPETGKPLSDFVAKAMHRDRECRFASADEMHDALVQIAERSIGQQFAKAMSIPPIAGPGKVPAKTQSLIFAKTPLPPGVAQSTAAKSATGSLSTIESIVKTSRRKMWLPWAVAGSTVILLSIVAVNFFYVKSNLAAEGPAPRYIVVKGASESTPPKAVDSKPTDTGKQQSAAHSLPAVNPAMNDRQKTNQIEGRVDVRKREKKQPDKLSEPRETSETRAVELARSFSSQKEDVIKCFNESAIDMSETARLSVRLELTQDGVVRSARVYPDNIADTATGKCVVKAALAMKYGPQKEPISFRVPLTARRGR
jgi:serine/threonine protein kinase